MKLVERDPERANLVWFNLQKYQVLKVEVPLKIKQFIVVIYELNQ